MRVLRGVVYMMKSRGPRTVMEFGVNGGGGNGTSCCGIEVRTDTTKLPNMMMARFGEGRNLVGKVRYIKDSLK